MGVSWESHGSLMGVSCDARMLPAELLLAKTLCAAAGVQLGVAMRAKRPCGTPLDLSQTKLRIRIVDMITNALLTITMAAASSERVV